MKNIYTRPGALTWLTYDETLELYARDFPSLFVLCQTGKVRSLSPMPNAKERGVRYCKQDLEAVMADQVRQQLEPIRCDFPSIEIEVEALLAKHKARAPKPVQETLFDGELHKTR